MKRTTQQPANVRNNQVFHPQFLDRPLLVKLATPSMMFSVWMGVICGVLSGTWWMTALAFDVPGGTAMAIHFSAAGVVFAFAVGKIIVSHFADKAVGGAQLGYRALIEFVDIEPTTDLKRWKAMNHFARHRFMATSAEDIAKVADEIRAIVDE